MSKVPKSEDAKTVREDSSLPPKGDDAIEPTLAMGPEHAADLPLDIAGDGSRDDGPCASEAASDAGSDDIGTTVLSSTGSDPTAATFLTQNAADDAATVGTVLTGGAPTGDSSPAKVKTVDRFELERVLGQGAFGTVYLARDPRLDRAVAIKVARTGVLNSKKDIDRFNREACAAAQLRHPNIVPVYEVGQAQGSTYIVYEYIEGTTLKDKLKKGKLPADEAVRMMVSIASALHYAHESGIIHRDMKPENVLLDKKGQPHIADFGLARREEDATRTREGTLMGTPAYMSPEQAAGRMSDIDRRTDVWSLGIMLDELLTARRPFTGSIVEVLAAVKDQPIKPLRTIDPTLPVDLETICLKALERDLARRFQTAGDFADELQRWQRGEPITIRRITAFERINRWARRNQTVATLLAVLFAVLMLGTTVSTWFGITATRTATQLTAERDARARSQIKSVLRAEPGAVSALLDELKPLAGNQAIVGRLREMTGEADSDPVASSRMDLLQLYLSADSETVSAAQDRLLKALLTAEPREFLMLREQLAGFVDQGLLCDRLSDPAESSSVRLHAAAAMALYDDESNVWTSEVGADVASLLLAEGFNLSDWVRALRPIRNVLRGPLLRIFANSDSAGHDNAGLVLALHFGDDSAEVISELVTNADADQLGLIAGHRYGPQVIDHLEQRLLKPYPRGEAKERKDAEDQVLANHLLTLVNQPKTTEWELSRREWNGVRGHFIDRAARTRLAPDKLLRVLKSENEPLALQTAILSLADLVDVTPGLRSTAVAQLHRLYVEHPDAGVHGAIDWLMRKWQQGKQLDAWSKSLMSSEWPKSGRNWHHDANGLVFAILRKPGTFSMGTDDPIRGLPPKKVERPHNRTIPHSFAITMKEITLAQFRQFRADHQEDEPLLPSHPAKLVRWCDAAAYCVHLSQNGKVDQDQLCYVPGKGKGILHAKPRSLELSGYRLPTSAEWEYACRGGTTTLRYYGSGSALLSSYAWVETEKPADIKPVGQLLPNQFGLFDSLGNVAEWCHTWFDEDHPQSDNDLVDGFEPKLGTLFFREARGGSVDDRAADVVSGARTWGDSPISFSNTVGFRVARTLPD